MQPHTPCSLPGNWSCGCHRNHNRWNLASCISRKSFCSRWSSGLEVAAEMSVTIGPSCTTAASSQAEFSTKDRGRRASPRVTREFSGQGVQTNCRNLIVWTNRLMPELDSELWRLHVASLTGKTCSKNKEKTRKVNPDLSNLLESGQNYSVWL